jgi:RecA-family ATPase
VAFLGKPIRLLESEDIVDFGDSVEATGVTPALVVIDTLARNAVGLDENSAMDMGRLVGSCDSLRNRFDATVLLVHHSTKGGNGFAPRLRGSGALEGACDMIAVVKEDGEHIALACEKQKEGAPFKKMKFLLHPVGNSVVLLAEGKTGKQAKQDELDFPT